MKKPGLIFTVIVVQEIPLHLLISFLLIGTQLSVPLHIPPQLRRRAVPTAIRIATLHAESLELSQKWSILPVNLLFASACCPILTVPNAGLNSHCLSRKLDSCMRQVLKNSDRDIIYIKPERRKKQEGNLKIDWISLFSIRIEDAYTVW